LKFSKRVLAAMATVPVAGAIFFGGTADAATTPAGVKGIDVSAYQHPNGKSINWTDVRKGGYKFAFIKDTEGTYYVNPWYETDLKSAEAQGLKVGSYAFARPNGASGGAQALYLLSHGGYQHGELPPTLDIEWNPYSGNQCYNITPTQMSQWIIGFEDTIHSKTGVWATINTPESWWNTCMAQNTTWGARVPLWDENNRNSTPSNPVLPSGWKTWTYWQFTITGRVSGVPATVDADVQN
jgi:GH25 family lysozyme M1 (1,4-beta-N-acetylmuramidase)